MNRISPGLNIGQAIGGFLQAKTAEARSPRTRPTCCPKSQLNTAKKPTSKTTVGM